MPVDCVQRDKHTGKITLNKVFSPIGVEEDNERDEYTYFYGGREISVLLARNLLRRTSKARDYIQQAVDALCGHKEPELVEIRDRLYKVFVDICSYEKNNPISY